MDNKANRQHESSADPRFLMVAGSHSGVGKTTITLGLMAALQKKGLKVQGFKVGPDFIDPGHHTRVAGEPCRNLDGWMLSKRYNRAAFGRAMRGKDIGVVEGVMGLFDGYDGRSEAGSTAQMAKWLGAPVILVVDASSMARSIAALVHGFATFDAELCLAAVIANRVGSLSHTRFLSEAMASVPDVTFLGAIPRNEAIVIPERHLGLATSDEEPYAPELFQRLTSLVETHLDLDAVLDLTASGIEDVQLDQSQIGSDKVKLGVARDEAFSFYYQDNLDLLVSAGAELCDFSPLRDHHLPRDLDGLYLGGGYPELYARQLESNKSLKSEILAAARNGMPVYAECGGFMYLTRSIRVDAGAFDMVGLYPFDTRMLSHRKALGYREIVLKEDCLLGPKGLKARGHEFHYSELIDEPKQIPRLFHVTPRKGVDTVADGFMMHNALAGYVHVHFGSNPHVAASFVDICRKYRDRA
ncbi:MAG: cobyrinate a,c-diamide synthase [Deltaproteobacteria bacterium]|nr:MAG: cobyrinate a,c-diamide synthase [Deltaproteobacteria bacterium]